MTSLAPAPEPSAVPAVDRPEPTRTDVRLWLRTTLTADFSPLPVVISLAVIAIVFQSLNSRFLSAENLSNLVAQVVSLGFLAAGVVLILLIGEIDLSVGIVSGLASAVMAVLGVRHGWPAWAAILAALLVGGGIGLVNGFFVTSFRLPSFVVTLAGLIAWQGVLFGVLGNSGSVNVSDTTIIRLTSLRLTHATGYVLAVLAAALYFGVQVLRHRRRVRNELPVRLLIGPAVTGAGLLVAAVFAVWLLNRARGVSLALVLLIAVLVLLNTLTRRRTFGRHVFAVGGNVEAARRGGVRVRRVKIMIFVLGSTIAALSGVFAASRLLAVSTGSGSSDVLLNAIAAAVIGGTSLFGGRGSVWAALLGSLVIGGISNGMDLLSFGPATKFVITGAVLLVAVTVDATLRSQYRTTLD